MVQREGKQEAQQHGGGPDQGSGSEAEEDVVSASGDDDSSSVEEEAQGARGDKGKGAASRSEQPAQLRQHVYQAQVG